MSADDTRRKIERLRALAASTTFPAERAAALAKADAMELALNATDAGDFPTFEEAYAAIPAHIRDIWERTVRYADSDEVERAEIAHKAWLEEQLREAGVEFE